MLAQSVIITVLACLPCRAADFCLTAVPQSPKQSALSLGTGKDFFPWELVVTHSTGPVSRPDIVERLPFSILFYRDAEDVLNRRVAGDKRTIFAAYYGSIKDVGPGGLAFAASRVHHPLAQGLLLVFSGLWALSQSRVSARAPTASSTLQQLLPDTGTLGDWDGKVITGVQHKGTKMGPDCNAPQIYWESTAASNAARLKRIMEVRAVMAGDQI